MKAILILWITLASAAASSVEEQNVRSMQVLTWARGRGWSLYACLVARTVGVEVPMEGEAFVASPEFSAGVKQWQKIHGLPTSGVVDAETLGAMKSEWQSQRPFHLGLPAEKEMVDIPIGEAAQGNALRVGRRTYEAYHKMREAALADGVPKEYLTVISAYRSPQYQKNLLRKNPRANGNQLGRSSTHSNGRALDLNVGGVLVSTRDSNRALQVRNRAYRWLIRNAGKYGFTPYFFEPWHWEFAL